MCVRGIILLLSCVACADADIYETALKSYYQGAYADAAASYKKAEEVALTPFSRATGETGLGICLQRLGKEEEATQWLRRAVEIWRTLPGAGNEMARASLWLVEAERTLGHFTVVEQILRTAIHAHPSPGLEAELHNRLAVILRETGKTEEARGELQAVLAMPGIAPRLEVDALLGKAELDRHAMRYADSLESLRRALNLVYPANEDPDNKRARSDVLQGLGLTYMSLGDLARAESALSRSLALTSSGDGATPQRIGTALQCLAALHAKNHKYGVAEQELLQALDCLSKTLSDGHPQIAAVMGDLADVYRLENRLDEARQYAGRAYSAMRSSLGPDSVGAAESLGVLAKAEAQQNSLEDAAEHYAHAIEILRGKGAEHDVRMASLMNGYAAVLDSLHRGREAKQVRTELNSFLPRER
jgi:tetratricopeptide (TPR) repeat protein